MNLWREYSLSYIKENKASTISILIASLIASALLSLLCGVFYNIWIDETTRIKQQEGEWHAKITGDLSEEDISAMRGFPNVKMVEVKNGETDGVVTAYLYLLHPSKVYRDMPGIVHKLGAENRGRSEIQLEYHEKLMTQYFIFAKGHQPPTILVVYGMILLLSVISLILVIHNAFGVSMTARVHQLGILQSVGATPGQIRLVLTFEAVTLCLIPVFLGILAGIGLCFLFMIYIKEVSDSVRSFPLVFRYHPLVLLTALILSLATVWYSARIPARKLSRLSPLEAIRYEGEQTFGKSKKKGRLSSRLFGIEGELAGKSLYTRRKAFRTATLSLTVSFLVLVSFFNLEAISGISTGYTFFERYKNIWDLMVTTEEPASPQNEILSKVRKMAGVRSCISYQRMSAQTTLTEDRMEDKLVQSIKTRQDDLKDTGMIWNGTGYQVEAVLLVLDDESFLAYCEENQISSDLFQENEEPGVVLINTVWDEWNSNRRNKIMIPFLKENEHQTTLQLKLKDGTDLTKEQNVKVRIAAFTDQLPKLREEYENFSLVQLMSESTCNRMINGLFDAPVNYTIRVNQEDLIPEIQNTFLTEPGLQKPILFENRAETEQRNITIRKVYRVVMGCLAGLLIIIGLANILSNTMGLIYQRKRELARYISIGLSPRGVVQILMLEATILVVRPILISLLLNIPIVLLALNASMIPLSEFVAKMPVIPVVLFAAVTIGAVEAAYYLGGRSVYRMNPVEHLKDDTLM